MEFDCRAANPDAVSWECKVTLPDGEVVQLRFREFAQIPGEISMDNQGNSEVQLWASLAWGLIEPKHWPLDSKDPGSRVFAKIPTSTVIKIHEAWQTKAGVTQGESSASKTSSESAETS